MVSCNTQGAKHYKKNELRSMEYPVDYFTWEY